MKIECPSCQQPIQIDLEEPKAVRKIRRLAKNFSVASAILAGFGMICFLGAIVSWKGAVSDRNAGVPEDHIGHAAADFWLATYWCITTAIILFAVAQITHIRANTEK